MGKGDDSIRKNKGGGGAAGNARLIITSNNRNAGFLVTLLFLALESEGSLKPSRVDPEVESRRNLCPAGSLAKYFVGPVHSRQL